MDGPTTKGRKKPGKRAPAKLTRIAKPEELTLDAWQIELRKQFGRQQQFAIKNVGDEPIFSEFEVTNPESGNTYRVAVRGSRLGENFCACPDFATNTLGTCKHIEFTLAYLERKRGGKAALDAGFQPPYSEIYLQYGAQREVRFRPGSECPVELARLAENHFDSEGILDKALFASIESFLKEAANHEHDLRCFDDVLAFVAEVLDAEQREIILKEAFPKGIRSKAFHKLVRTDLYDYQREGALFAARVGRCLIGDEMGLGKTIQALAAAEIMAKNFGIERVLVICPTSLKHQWEREIDRFTERSRNVIGGLRASREELFAAESFFKITNYDTVHRDLDLIQAWAPELVILDEAQRIKNWGTRAARSVKRIVSPYAMVLTGTPLENRLEELVSIVQFIDRFRLGPTFRLLHDHQMHDEVGKVVGYRDLNKIGATLEPIMLRRQKDKVLDQLPERLDKNFFVPMTEEQSRHHSDAKDIVAKVVSKWRRYHFLTEADKRRLMVGLQCMRMSCDSTFLLDKTTDIGPKADEVTTLLEEIFEDPATKVVIFSQWLNMHELLVRRFKERGWPYVLFHGGVPSSGRKQLVDRFRDDPNCRAFLSTDAGGVGLNLQHASVVINMDLPWNPGVLEQRIGRVHRLGQKSPVRVVNFISQGTIEEGMLSVLKFKKSLFAGVLDGGETEISLGGSRLNRFIETVENATGAIAPSMPQDPSEGPEAAEGGIPSAREIEAEAAAPLAPTQAPAVAPDNPWAGLLETGLTFLQRLQESTQPALTHSASNAAPSPLPARPMVARDERTGETYLKVPMPTPEVLDRAMQSFRALLECFGK